jgi:hypothetical protein
MFGKRSVGLSNRQPVPHLLSVIGNSPVTKNMKDVDVDAPPQSSSDDDDGLPTKADIKPTSFVSVTGGRKLPAWLKKDENVSDKAPAGRSKRTRASAGAATGRESGSKPKGTRRQVEAIETDNDLSSPALKRPKRSPSSDRERGIQFGEAIFAERKPAGSRRYGKSSSFGSKAKEKALPARTTKLPPKESTPDSPERFKLNLPSLPPGAEESLSSPVRKYAAIPEIDFDSPADESPIRKKRLKIPEDDSLPLFEDREKAEESQRPLFSIPDELPDSFIGGSYERIDFAVSGSYERINFAVSPAADTPNTSNPILLGSSSPLTELESLDQTAVCPLCRKEVDKAQLSEFFLARPHMSVANMRKFCELHRRRSARETWLDKGYPDIEWPRLDERIARHYAFIRGILEGSAPSHYDALFGDAVRSGRNRTLLQSDANLTPGYYGIRGLRAMTENLISEFAPLLRIRSREDKLVSARGHTMYLQSVLVPELAVKLIMEDMGVGAVEAREILTESSEVGELLNDEIPDVVLNDSDDDDKSSDDGSSDGGGDDDDGFSDS